MEYSTVYLRKKYVRDMKYVLLQVDNFTKILWKYVQQTQKNSREVKNSSKDYFRYRWASCIISARRSLKNLYGQQI